MVIPLMNVLPERGTSYIKRIKNKMLSTIKYGLLNALLMISMNGNNCVSDEAERVIKAAVCYCGKTRRIKELIKYFNLFIHHIEKWINIQ